MKQNVNRRHGFYIIALGAVAVVSGLAYFAIPAAIERPAAAVATSSPPQPQSSGGGITAPAISTNRTARPQPKFQVERFNGRAYALRQSFDPRPGDVAQVVADLLPVAEAGDEVAAFEIYRKVGACRDAFAMARESAPSTDPEKLIPQDCRGIPVDQWRGYTARWLEASAEGGFVPAQLAYAIDSKSVIGSGPEIMSDPDALAAYRRKAMGYMQRAASTGSVDALSMLAGAYASGILTKRDPALAYAYFHAKEMATGNTDSVGELLRQRYEIGLSKSDIRRARQQGRSIYEGCCSP